MKNLLIIGLFLLFSKIGFGQDTLTIPKTIFRGDTHYTAYPDIILVVDTLQIKLDSTSIKQIRPNWVRSMELIMNEKYKDIYGNTNGVLMIYPKKKFKKAIAKVLNIKQ
jgi:hypothetical protein